MAWFFSSSWSVRSKRDSMAGGSGVTAVAAVDVDADAPAGADDDAALTAAEDPLALSGVSSAVPQNEKRMLDVEVSC